jgi:Transcriptional regulators
MKKLTIRDIARLAGVSKSTISRVLNQDEHVDPETRDHILQVIAENDFIPSLNARGLNGQSQLIGLLLPALTWPMILEIIRGISQVVENSAYELILYNFRASKNFDDVVNRIIVSGLSAGLLAMPLLESLTHLIDLYRQGLPVVLINTVGLRAELPLVVADNYGGAYQAVQYLTRLGHRRIGYIQDDVEYPCYHDRYQGYCAALNDVGIQPDPLLFGRDRSEGTSSLMCADALLNLDEPPTAFFTATDKIASGVLDAAKMRGLRIPQDISVVGFNDDPFATSVHPTLTTVHQPFREMGQCAVELLFSLLNPLHPFPEDWKKFAVDYRPSSSVSLEKQGETLLQIQLPANLVVRESCGLVRAASSSTTLL